MERINKRGSHDSTDVIEVRRLAKVSKGSKAVQDLRPGSTLMLRGLGETQTSAMETEKERLLRSEKHASRRQDNPRKSRMDRTGNEVMEAFQGEGTDCVECSQESQG